MQKHKGQRFWQRARVAQSGLHGIGVPNQHVVLANYCLRRYSWQMEGFFINHSCLMESKISWWTFQEDQIIRVTQTYRFVPTVMTTSVVGFCCSSPGPHYATNPCPLDTLYRHLRISIKSLSIWSRTTTYHSNLFLLSFNPALIYSSNSAWWRAIHVSYSAFRSP